MNFDKRSELLLAWDDELLVGGVIVSEWSTFLIRDADAAFCAGADLAAILAAQAAMEAHLRYEYAEGERRRQGFAALIDRSPIPEDLAERLHAIRRCRNRWVHVNQPQEDADLLERRRFISESWRKWRCWRCERCVRSSTWSSAFDARSNRPIPACWTGVPGRGWYPLLRRVDGVAAVLLSADGNLLNVAATDLYLSFIDSRIASDDAAARWIADADAGADAGADADADAGSRSSSGSSSSGATRAIA